MIQMDSSSRGRELYDRTAFEVYSNRSLSIPQRSARLLELQKEAGGDQSKINEINGYLTGLAREKILRDAREGLDEPKL